MDERAGHGRNGRRWKAARGPTDAGIASVARLCEETVRRRGRLLVAGAPQAVGAFDALVGDLPVLVFDQDPSVLTSVANDFGPQVLLDRQVAGLGRAGDLLILFDGPTTTPSLGVALVRARAARIDTAYLGREAAPADIVVPVALDDAGAAARALCETLAIPAALRVRTAH